MSALQAGDTITVNAVAPGSVTLSVKDDKGTAKVKITVKPPMTLSKTALTLAAKKAGKVSVINPTGKVRISNPNPAVVKVEMSGSQITLVGKAAGSVTLTVRDSKTVVTLQVEVVRPATIATVSGNTQGRLLASNCFQCHGTYGSGGFEKLRGMSPQEMADELREFTAGGEHGDGIMAAHLQGYTDEQLNLIADYLANP